MARYQVILAYDGTAFNGMQRQLEARTVQGVVEEALSKIGWQDRSILIAGRTDGGVHASGQVVAFDLDWGHSPQDLQNALNSVLPSDVAVQLAATAKADFHPRYDALSRSYRYQIFCLEQRDPLRERYAWRVWPSMELARLQTTAQVLVGEHDFAAYGTPPKEGGPTIRKVFAAGWRQEGDSFTFEINANAYLYHMVRRIVGLQVEIGQGRLEPEFVSETLSGKHQDMIQGLAPPHGLFLTEVRYVEQEK